MTHLEHAKLYLNGLAATSERYVHHMLTDADVRSLPRFDPDSYNAELDRVRHIIYELENTQ